VAWVIHDAVAARAAREPDAPLVVDDEGVHTVGEVVACATTVAQAIRAAAGERPTVAAEARNDWRTVAVGLAVGELDGTLALMPSSLTRGEAELALEDVDPDVLLATPASAAAWTPAASDEARIDDWRLVAFDGARPDARERWGDGILVGLTSGSTGRAKGIVQTEASLRYSVDNVAGAMGLERGDAIAAVTSLSSGPAFCFGPYLAWVNASPLVLVGRWEPAAVIGRSAR
jgi:acyl-CoA synthetase (AMP-forming)/AMP-acid ligase II